MIQKKTILEILAVALFILGFSSCSKKEEAKPQLAINSTDITLYYDQTFQLELKRGNQKLNFSDVTSASTDEFVGRVNSSGIFEAAHIGETEITLVHERESVKVKVTVMPRQTFLVEPSVEFGRDKSFIKLFEKRELLYESADGLIFKGENSNVLNVFYGFRNGQFFGAIVSFPLTSNNMERVVEYYRERYNYDGQLDDYFVHSNRSKSLMVALTIIDGELAAIYTANSSFSGTMSFQMMLRDFKNAKTVKSIK